MRHTRVDAIEPGRLATARGAVLAESIIRATEGYTDTIEGERRRIMPLYSMVTATEPLPEAVWQQIGLKERETFGDSRRVVIYGQRTLDDRLVLGGRAGYYFASRRRRSIPSNDPKVVRVKHLVKQAVPDARRLSGHPRLGRPDGRAATLAAVRAMGCKNANGLGRRLCR